MTPEDNETIENRAETEESKKPWRWGDEIEESEKKPEGETPPKSVGRSYTSLAELEEAEKILGKLILDKYHKKPQDTEPSE